MQYDDERLHVDLPGADYMHPEDALAVLEPLKPFLPKRQYRIATLKAQGLRQSDIARALGISYPLLFWHIKQTPKYIHRAIWVKSVCGKIRYAIRHLSQNYQDAADNIIREGVQRHQSTHQIYSWLQKHDNPVYLLLRRCLVSRW